MGKWLVLFLGLAASLPVASMLQADNLSVRLDLEYRVGRNVQSGTNPVDSKPVAPAAAGVASRKTATRPLMKGRPAPRANAAPPVYGAIASMSAKAAPSARRALHEYLISPGDVISVRVFGEPDLSLNSIRVPTDGLVSYPLLGQIRINQHTVRSLEKRLTTLLSNGFLIKPKVSVSIVEYRPVFVKGGVNSPGAHGYAEGLTVEKALALAGGLSKSGQVEGITVLRDNGQPQSVGLEYWILPGDVVTIPEVIEDDPKQFIYLHGEVKNPGSYEYREELTVEKALALAGGFSDRASKRKIQISRENESGEFVRMKRVGLDVSVEPGDVITVGASLF